MKLIISSKILDDTLKLIESKEIECARIVNQSLCFVPIAEREISIHCETNFYSKPSNLRIDYNKEIWIKIKEALKYFPEQPIVMEIDSEGYIEITQCVLKFVPTESLKFISLDKDQY